MNVEGWLQQIQPDLTLYGVLLTFGILSFLGGRQLWRYEKELVQENVQRLRELMDGFRTTHIEPVLEIQLRAVAEASYLDALRDLQVDLYGTEAPESKDVEPPNWEDFAHKLSATGLSDRISAQRVRLAGRGIEEFFSSASGEKFFDDLDRLYGLKQETAHGYLRAKHACACAAYSFVGLSVLMFSGLARIVTPWPTFVLYPWISLCLTVLALAIGALIRMEVERRRLIGRWEKLQIHNQV